MQIPLSAVVAFGDGDNDKEMLEGVGCGIAMANATALTKQRAHKTSRWTNEQHAVARELEVLMRAGAFGTLA